MQVSAKQFRTIAGQITLLQQRGMTMDGSPQRWLEAVNYYRLSGYWYPYRALAVGADGLTRSDRFVPGTKFSEIERLDEFDRKLRTLSLDGIERVEVALRAQASYVLGAKDPLAHESAATFRDTFDHATWLANAQGRVQRAARRSAFISHHLKHYGGVIPVWVLVDVLDFADVSMLFDGMRAADQFAVAEGLGISLDLARLNSNQRSKALKNHPLARWLEQLTVLRNSAAHHARLWNRNLTPAPSPAMRTVDGLDCLPAGQSEDLFGALTVIAKILQTTSPGSSWAQKVAEQVEHEFETLPLRTISEMGFPDGWRAQALWA